MPVLLDKIKQFTEMMLDLHDSRFTSSKTVTYVPDYSKQPHGSEQSNRTIILVADVIITWQMLE
jgi:hypothetical protein